ncbi:MAG: prepilin peptidase [Planctomycetes bacterium]|nr:prepilin peptidase [Planctomycetota bacterium]
MNVCIYRIPKHDRLWDQLRGLSYPPSSCPSCGNRIFRRDNIPIFGWLKLLGRCRFCRSRISPRYPFIELLNGLLFVAVYWCEIPESPFFSPARFSPDGISHSETVVWLHLLYAYHMVLIEALVVASFIDFDLKIIPDGATLPAMAVGLLGGAVIGNAYLVPIWVQDPYLVATMKSILPESIQGFVNAEIRVPAWTSQYPHWHGLAVSLAGLLVGGGMVWTVRIIGASVLRREAMGFGDVVLMAMIGSFLGWQPIVVVLFLGAICAVVVVVAGWIFRRYKEIPFGPYLSLAAVIMIVDWKHIWPFAERIFHFGPLIPVMALFMAVSLFLSLHAMQLVKRMFGIPLYPAPEWTEEWTSADQLTHHAGEHVDPQQGRWRTEEWPGTTVGRGLSQEQRWRRDD